MISIIVVVKNRTEYIEKCIRTLRDSGTDTEITLYSVGTSRDVKNICMNMFQDGLLDHLMLDYESATLFNTYVDGLKFIERQPHDVILLTADDYAYVPGWGAKVEAFLSGNHDVVTASCDMEPLFPWNAPDEIVEHNGVRALSRATIPGANWCFTALACDMVLRPLIEAYQNEMTVDHDINGHIRNVLKKKLCALPLADHVGAYNSEAGNQAFQVQAQPLPKQWQI